MSHNNNNNNNNNNKFTELLQSLSSSANSSSLASAAIALNKQISSSTLLSASTSASSTSHYDDTQPFLNFATMMNGNDITIFQSLTRALSQALKNDGADSSSTSTALKQVANVTLTIVRLLIENWKNNTTSNNNNVSDQESKEENSSFLFGTIAMSSQKIQKQREEYIDVILNRCLDNFATASSTTDQTSAVYLGSIIIELIYLIKQKRSKTSIGNILLDKLSFDDHQTSSSSNKTQRLPSLINKMLKHPSRSPQSVEVACRTIYSWIEEEDDNADREPISDSISKNTKDFVNPTTIEALIENMKNTTVCLVIIKIICESL